MFYCFATDNSDNIFLWRDGLKYTCFSLFPIFNIVYTLAYFSGNIRGIHNTANSIIAEIIKPATLWWIYLIMFIFYLLFIDVDAFFETPLKEVLPPIVHYEGY